MRTETAGITRSNAGLDGITWNILGQTYVPKLLCDNAFTWYAEFPPGTFVPPHLHPTQDEWISMLEGEFELVLGGEAARADRGDVIRLPMGEPHGIFNKSDRTVRCLFGVAPARRLFDLFQKLHNMTDVDEMVRLSAEHEVEFLPPPAP